MQDLSIKFKLESSIYVSSTLKALNLLHIYLNGDNNIKEKKKGDYMNRHDDKARELFKQGYNCSQAVVLSFADELPIDFDSLVKISASFGGGIGRNSDSVRAMALEGLEFLGVTLDENKNRKPYGGQDISADDSRVRIYVVDTNEEIIVARKAKSLLEK